MPALATSPLRRNTTSDPWGRLDQFRANTTSQNGEDGLLAYLLAAYPAIPKTSTSEPWTPKGRHGADAGHQGKVCGRVGRCSAEMQAPSKRCRL